MIKTSASTILNFPHLNEESKNIFLADSVSMKKAFEYLDDVV